MAEAADNAGTERVAAGGKYDRDGSGGTLRSQAAGRAEGDDNVDVCGHERGGETIEAGRLTASVEIGRCDRAALDITQFEHSAPVFLEIFLFRLSGRDQPADPRNFMRRLLRAGREGPCCGRSCDYLEEIASSHWRLAG